MELSAILATIGASVDGFFTHIYIACSALIAVNDSLAILGIESYNTMSFYWNLTVVLHSNSVGCFVCFYIAANNSSVFINNHLHALSTGRHTCEYKC